MCTKFAHPQVHNSKFPFLSQPSVKGISAAGSSAKKKKKRSFPPKKQLDKLASWIRQSKVGESGKLRGPAENGRTIMRAKELDNSTIWSG